MAIDINKYTRQDRLRHADLQGQTVTTIIQGLKEQKWDDGDEDLMIIVKGREGLRSVKVSATSCKLLQEGFGSVVEEWKGKKVRLVPVTGSTAQYNGIRVEPA